MSSITNVYTLADQIKDTIKAHGHAAAAKHYAKRIPFTAYHFYAFGFLPRTVLKVESSIDSSSITVRVVRCII